jgi:hypothetical protein
MGTINTTNQDVIAPVTLVETEFGRLWVVGVCPFCSYRHTHSAGYPWEDPQDWLGERTTYCTGRARTYRLVERDAP